MAVVPGYPTRSRVTTRACSARTRTSFNGWCEFDHLWPPRVIVGAPFHWHRCFRRDGSGLKKFSQQAMRGEEGVTLVASIVQSMGFVWRPTSSNDTGIDGTIEVRDAETGQVTNRIIQVQIKATERAQVVDSYDRASFRCSRDDIEYWLGGNTPVILVLCSPKQKAAWWLDVKAYVASKAQTRQTCTFEFLKQRDKFDESARDKLAQLAPLRVGTLHRAIRQIGATFLKFAEHQDAAGQHLCRSDSQRRAQEARLAVRRLRTPRLGSA